VGYLLFIDWYATDDSAEAETLARMEALDQRLDETNSNLAALESQSGPVTHPDFGADIAAVKRDLEEQLRLQSSLPSRMTSIENSVAALAGISAGARETFLLAEAEYYLQIANAQLQLASNPHLAALALGMADERVTQISDPGLTAVRSAIADEITALELLQKPDIEGATLTLGSLARVAEYLPLAGTEPTQAEQEEESAEQSNIDRAWGSVKDAMSGLVKVTPPDQAQRALIAPDAEYFLRNNIALQLQSARLALLRGEQTIFEQTLDDTSALLNTYFDVNSEQVISAQQTISEIRNDVFTTSMPDISASLRMLRQFRTLRETDE
jgi:uroporphyrin-3 C-methyltransferase